MVSKLQKYREERDRNTARITRLQDRNDVLDRKIADGENSEIRALLSSANITVDELAALIRAQQEIREPVPPIGVQHEELTADADDPIYPAYDAEENENTEDEDDTEDDNDEYDT